MLKRIYIITILLSSLSLFSQKEAANWYFGDKAGLDFNSGSPLPLLNGQMDQLEGCASISSSTGQLRIYTDGISVYNFNHQIILNGTGLMGDPSSTQSAIIIPAPGNPDIYYIFTTPKEAGAVGLRYTQVDMSLDGGNGAVTALKNIALDPGFLTAEKLTAIKHSDNSKIWVVAHRMGNDQFVSYLIDNNGVNTTPVVSAIGKIHTVDLGAGAIGYLKSSSNGKKIACGVLIGTNTGLELFDFDNTSGILSNVMALNIYSVYGVEFSGDNKKLYYSSDFQGKIYQYDLTAGNLAAIKQSVKQITTENKYGGLQLALDGKIYAAKRFENHLGVINNPNETGVGSNFVGNGVNLGGKISELGLPPFIQSYFLQDIKAEQFCANSPTLFSITMSAAIVSANWNFGDGNTSNQINPEHTYQAGGAYNVTVSFTTNAGPDIIHLSKQIIIIASPLANQPNDMKICVPDNDPATFNLVLQTPAVLGNQTPTDLVVTYYASQADLTNGNAITTITHTLSSQTIIAKITNAVTGCFDTVEFKTIRIAKPRVFGKADLTICNQNGITGTFDLTQNTALILGNQDPAKFGVNYYITAALANDGTPGTEITLPQTYSSVNAIIYARVYNLLSPECYEIVSFSLTVLRSPVLNPNGNPFRYVMCPDIENTTTATINTIDFIKNSLSNSQFLNIPLLDLNAIPVQDTDLSNYSITYYKLLSDAQNDTARLTNGYVATDGETIYVRVKHNLAIDCFAIGEIVLWIKTPQITVPTPLFACSDGSPANTAIFKLSQKNAEITQNQIGNNIKYYETLQAAQIGGNNTISDVAYTGYNLQIVYARVENTQTGCYATTSLTLEVIPAPIAAVPAPLEICDSNNDGFGVYNLDPVIQAIQTALGNVVVTVHETPEDADFNTNKITVTNAYDSSHLTIQTLYIRVQSGQTVCYDVVELKLIANPTPVAVTPSPYALCDDGVSDTDGQAVFNLTTKANEVLGTLDPALYSVSYYTDAAATIMIGNPVTHLSGSTDVYIKVSNNATGCFTVVKLKLIVNALPTAVQPTEPLRLCDVTAPLKDGIEIFDLTSVIPSIIGAQQGINVTFHHSYAAAQSNTGAIATPNAYPSGPAVETLFVRVTVEATGCYRIVLQDLKVEPLPEILRPTQDALTVCDTDGNGIGEFNLEDLVDAMKNGEPNLEVTFHHTLEDAQNGDNPIGNTTAYINTDPYLEFIYVRVVNTVTGCVNSEVYQLRLIVEPAVQAPALGPLSLCDEDANNQDLKTFFNLSQQDAVIYTALNAAPGSLTIYYFIDEASARAGAPRITTPGHYLGSDAQVIWVRVQGANGCFSVTSFVLKVNRPLLLTTPTMLTLCNEVLPNDGQAVFDLTTKNNEILGPLGVGKGYTVRYYESNPKTNPLALPIADPTAYTNPAPPAGNPKTLYVVVTSKEGCRSYTTLTIKVLPLPMPDTTPDDLVMCNEDNSVDGKEAFDLTKAEADIRNNDNQSLITYHSTLADAEAGTNKIAVPTAYLSATGSVWVRMEANTNNPSDPKCYQVVELKLIVNPLPAIGDANGNVPPYAICEPNTNGFADFDLNSHIEKILGTNSAADYDIEFYLDQAALDAGTALPRLYTNVVANSQTILVLVTNKATGCSITKPLQLLVEESAIANPITLIFNECDTEGANDGKITWDLTQADPQVLGGQNPADYKVSYYTSLADAEAGVNAIPVPAAYLNAVPGGETIWVRVTNTATISKCHDITTIELIVELLPEPKIQGGTICVDKITDEVLRSYEITTGLDASHLFVWSDDKGVIPGETGPSLIVSKPGNYSVVATSATGCVSAPVTPVEVIQSGPASKVGVGYYVSNAFSDVQTITVEVEGYSVYQYKLDEGPWQDSPVFTDVSRGEHKVTVRDVKTANPCDDLVIEGASVIDYPNFFTPNGDGFHDTWNIVGLQGSGAVIYIFDRYGKLMKQISPDENGGWDGTFNGSPVPATDYWFTVTYPETVGSTGVTVNKEFKAHFSLKR